MISEPAPFRLALLSVADDSTPQQAWGRGAYEMLRAAAGRNVDGRFELVDDPAAAHAILFAEYRDEGFALEAVRRHPVVRAWPDRCLVYSPADVPVPVLPGLYPSLIRGTFSSHWAQSFCYLHPQNPTFAPRDEERRYLFSFTGDVSTHPVRRRLFALAGSETPVIDTRGQVREAALRGDAAELARLAAHFDDYAAKSWFMVCPRGAGVGSIRLFQAMQAGRAPVIVSDGWTEPYGPDWSTFSLRIDEDEIDFLPQLLRARQADAATMGRLARAAWDRHFGDDVLFARVAERCRDLQASRRRAAGRGALVRYAARPQVVRGYLRDRRARLLQKDS